MCGIVGMVNGYPVARDLLQALARLEYRGYDSAGIAVVAPGFAVTKVVGCSRELEAALAPDAPAGQAGIGHTRWATHGRADTRNAHPHVWDGVAVVHNGIVENHAALREELRAEGHGFLSDTDSEVIPHLIADALRQGLEPLDAFRRACARLEGAYAVAALCKAAPGRIFVARKGSPLVVAEGEGLGAVASDPVALHGLAPRYAALEDGEVAELTHAGVRIFDGRLGARRAWIRVDSRTDTPGGRSFAHHTRREISEQPAALRATDAGLRGIALPHRLVRARRLQMVACGSSFYAAGVARGFIEQAAGLPCDIEVASEFRYRVTPPASRIAAVLVSQSGETADTLATLESFRQHKLPTIGVVNAPHSAIGRGADLLWPTAAGPELGVAATKSFTAQLLALMRFGLALGAARGGGDAALRRQLAEALDGAAEVCAAAEAMEDRIAAIARRIAGEGEALFIGRGWGAALAGEGALKLKELSYIRAEGYAAGELKHGPIALVRAGSPVLVCAPSGPLLPKVLSNAQAVRARGAHTVLLTDAAGADQCAEAADEILLLPGNRLQAPFAQAVAVQLVAYHAALALGRDVDRPRNLAKSVTVE